MPNSCKVILNKMVYKGAMTVEERDKILRNLMVHNGKWISHGIGNQLVPWGFDCSECGKWIVVGANIIKGYRYCPNCGAKMDGE